MVTLAVLRNNRTMEAIHDATEEERPRKRQCRHRVRFSEDKPQTFTFNNFEAMTPKEVKEIRERVWYTRQEFDSFLEDRLHTIRMWRAVQGNTRLIEPYYCCRGLEMYESAELNGNVLAARAAHTAAVLQEQERQRAAAPEAPLDWVALAKAVAPRSAWAMRQATRLALKDAMEAQEVWELDSGVGSFALGSMAAPLKRLSMPFSNTNTMPDGFSTMSRRLSLPMGSLYNTTNSSSNGDGNTTTLRRATVDVHKLKEMNRQFLKSVAGLQGSTMNAASKTTTSTLEHSNSLSLMLVRGRRLAMQQSNNANHSNAQLQQRRLAGLAQDATMSLGMRRDSLHGLLRDSTCDL